MPNTPASFIAAAIDCGIRRPVSISSLAARICSASRIVACRRSKPVEKQDKDLAAKIVKETDAEIVIRGTRMVSTLCAYAHDLLVLPSTYLATSKEAEPYAFGFSVAGSAFRLSPFGDPVDLRVDQGVGRADVVLADVRVIGADVLGGAQAASSWSSELNTNS
jgi:hypothetical protein